jgi:hypothetical protein
MQGCDSNKRRLAVAAFRSQPAGKGRSFEASLRQSSTTRARFGPGDVCRTGGSPRSTTKMVDRLAQSGSPYNAHRGLGKTTLAYHFAEEVVQTGAGNIEWIIWLTAKQQTFSALRGQFVVASKVDFINLPSLYGAILKALSHEMSPEEEEPTLNQIADRVVEALNSYSCLVIVDDIDSLSPEQQKETVAALNAIALRTVGREIAPSRVLMTSRVDQGMPPTAVIKISGLEEDEFATHLLNLCQTFNVKEIKSKDSLSALFEATSGSPLFAASIVRLLSLGEDLKSVVETWRGQEGEEVRKFAFEREVKRLDAVQSRLLYAVLLLGETSVNDLAAVLDVTPKVVRDRISELKHTI